MLLHLSVSVARDKTQFQPSCSLFRIAKKQMNVLKMNGTTTINGAIVDGSLVGNLILIKTVKLWYQLVYANHLHLRKIIKDVIIMIPIGD